MPVTTMQANDLGNLLQLLMHAIDEGDPALAKTYVRKIADQVRVFTCDNSECLVRSHLAGSSEQC